MRTGVSQVLFALCLAACALPALAHNYDQIRYIHTDAFGSVAVITDEQGNVVERFDYEPYGQIRGKPPRNGPGFTGHVGDGVTGMVNMQQRYFDPLTGRFISPDAVTIYDSGDLRHFNRYSYAYNNPYKYTDPDGRCPSCAGAAIGLGLDLAIQVTEMAMGMRTDISGASLAVSAGAGALGVGLAGKFGQLGGLAIDAAISGGSTAIKGQEVTAFGIMTDVALGEAGGELAARAIKRSPTYKIEERRANRLQRVGNKPEARAAQRERAQSAQPTLQLSVEQKGAQAGSVASGLGSAGAEALIGNDEGSK